jgi:hypothetical protein
MTMMMMMMMMMMRKRYSGAETRQKVGSIYNGYLWSYMTLRHVLKVTHAYCLACQYGGHPDEIVSEECF